MRSPRRGGPCVKRAAESPVRHEGASLSRRCRTTARRPSHFLKSRAPVTGDTLRKRRQLEQLVASRPSGLGLPLP
jgi:hypothetical protein